MRKFFALSIIMVCSIIVYAQEPIKKDSGMLLIEFTSLYSMPETSTTRFGNAPYIQRENVGSLAPPAPSDSIQYTRPQENIELKLNRSYSQVKVKNSTGKTVTSVKYKFSIFDRKTGKKLKTYTFVNKSNIKPDETAVLRNAAGNFSWDRAYECKAEIVKLMFTDGSVWTS